MIHPPLVARSRMESEGVEVVVSSTCESAAVAVVSTEVKVMMMNGE